MAEFQVVSRRKRKGKKSTAQVTSHSNRDCSSGVDVDELSSKLRLARNVFQGSAFITDLMDILKKSNLHNSPSLSVGSEDTKDEKYSEIVCYGLGNFADCYIARYQLGLLLALRDEQMFKDCVIHCYDPRFWTVEIKLLETLGLNILEKNEEGKRPVTSRTLFYMPHCSKSLCNNLLWANWSPWQLSRITVICNSFKNTCSSLPDRLLEQSCGFLKKILPHTVEHPLPENFQYDDVFNDTSMHWFLQEELQSAPEELWKDCEEPLYDSDDCEFILSSA